MQPDSAPPSGQKIPAKVSPNTSYLTNYIVLSKLNKMNYQRRSSMNKHMVGVVTKLVPSAKFA